MNENEVKNPFYLDEFSFKVLALYCLYKLGKTKMYEQSFCFGLTDETAILTIEEFVKKSVDEDGKLWIETYPIFNEEEK